MSTHNICFRGEIRKIFFFLGTPYLELCEVCHVKNMPKGKVQISLCICTV